MKIWVERNFWDSRKWTPSEDNVIREMAMTSSSDPWPWPEISSKLKERTPAECFYRYRELRKEEKNRSLERKSSEVEADFERIISPVAKRFEDKE